MSNFLRPTILPVIDDFSVLLIGVQDTDEALGLEPVSGARQRVVAWYVQALCMGVKAGRLRVLCLAHGVHGRPGVGRALRGTGRGAPAAQHRPRLLPPRQAAGGGATWYLQLQLQVERLVVRSFLLVMVVLDWRAEVLSLVLPRLFANWAIVWPDLPSAHTEDLGRRFHTDLCQPDALTWALRFYCWPGRRMRFDGTPLNLPELDQDDDWFPTTGVIPAGGSLGAVSE